MGEQDEEAHRKNYQQQIDELTTKVKRMEDALRATTTDYIVARRDKQAAEARTVAAEETQARERASTSTKVRTNLDCNFVPMHGHGPAHIDSVAKQDCALTGICCKREVHVIREVQFSPRG